MRFSSVILSAFCLLSPAAHAHAFLDGAIPAVGSTIASAPPDLVLNFTEGIEPRFTRVELLDSAGAPVATHDQRSGGPRQLLLGLPALKPGDYQVIWHAVSVDTHKTEGHFTFHVAP